VVTSTKCETGEADRTTATSNNVDALGDRVLVDLRPGKSRANLHCPRVFVDDNVLKFGQRDVYTRGRRESGIEGVTTAFDRKWGARQGDLTKLHFQM
jgi:hypothetical protein